MKIKCCKDCDHREIGCHATCEDYIRESEALKKHNERRRMDNAAGIVLFDLKRKLKNQ